MRDAQARLTRGHRRWAMLAASCALFGASVVAGACYSWTSERRLPGVRLAYGAEVTDRIERDGVAAGLPALRLAADIEYNQFQPVYRLYQAARDIGDTVHQLFALRRLVRGNQGHPSFRAELVLLLLEQGQAAEALYHAAIEIRLQPDSPDAHCHYATACAMLGRKQEARAHYQRALELNPGCEAARLGIEHPLVQGD